MTVQKNPIVRIYGFAVVVSLLLLIFVGLKQGLEALTTVTILAGLEITFSFDNAVVNARILQKMSRAWQAIFMTFGIFIAVFVVRVLLPIFIVSLTSSTGFAEIIRLVLHDPEVYARKLEIAQPMIATFGGIFLLMIFLEFVFAQRSVQWLKKLEDALVKIGKIQNISITLGITALFITTVLLVPNAEQVKVLFAGLAGLMTYLVVNALDGLVAGNQQLTANTSTLKAGIVGFLYLELIDASFSLDGVVGAFAITKSILLIAVGLGIGALFVRSLTVHMLRRGVLSKYIYLEHGAHYAIGILALVMLYSVNTHVPEFITGGAGLLVIIAAIIHSHSVNKKLTQASKSQVA